MILLIDIGNTRLKWATLVGGKLSEQRATPHAAMTQETLVREMLSELPRPEQVFAANVAGPALAELVAAAVQEHCGLETRFMRSEATLGAVRNGYRDPAKLGVDRWLAIVGAYAMRKAASLVVSVGTALTIDAVDDDGLHLGGVIAPGPQLMRSALFKNTSDIAARAAHGASVQEMLADNTLGAVEQGCRHACAALIERAQDALRVQLKRNVDLLVTGGAHAEVVGLLHRPSAVVPDLVLRGLAVAAAAARLE